MTRRAVVVLDLVLWVAVVVGVDFVFFRHRFWERLLANVGIVLVLAAFSLPFLKRPRAAAALSRDEPPSKGDCLVLRARWRHDRTDR